MSHPLRIAVAAAAVLVAVAAFSVSALARPQASNPKLIGVVGKNDAYKITLKTSAGKLVKNLKAGTYTRGHPRRLVDPQLRTGRAAREVLDLHLGAVQRHEDDDPQVRRRSVQGVLLTA